ncbi:hypothetical protein LPJ75_006039, partial [Coemansia sp. RSA 2598]
MSFTPLKPFAAHLLVAVLVLATSVAARHAQALVPRADNSTETEETADKEPKVQVNQMDLLSGVPAGLALLIGVIQVWPSPTQVSRRHLQEFLLWLKTSVERDFCVTLYSCTEKCYTRKYEANVFNMRRRLKDNVGATKHIGCVGTGDMTVEELVEVIQREDNGVALDELARVLRYPRMKALARAIRLLRFSPLFGRRVVFFQWFVVFFVYLFNWVFRNGLPQLVLRVLRFSYNVVRRVCGFPPIEYGVFRNYGLRYQIAELASFK